MMIFLLIHALICIVTGILMATKRIQVHARLYTLVLFLPIVGILILVDQIYVEKKQKSATKEIGLEKMTIDEIRYKRIDHNDSRDQDITVPLEEALVVNDAQTRRKLMIDILQKNPEENIGLLKSASATDDTEVSHYATTSMMSIQSRYEKQISEAEEAYRMLPESASAKRGYRRALKQYIDSTLITGNVLNIYQQKLKTVLIELMELYPDYKAYILEYLECRIALKETDGLEKEIESAMQRWPEEFGLYPIYVDYLQVTLQGERIPGALKRLKESGIYLHAEERQWFEFWNRGQISSK